MNHFLGCDTPEISDIIARGNFDAFIVSGWHLKAYWQAVRACRRAAVPVFVRGDSQLRTPRSRVKRLLKEIAYRPLLRQFDGFFVVGRRNREYLSHYGVPERKLFFVPHFVDNEWFAQRAEQARARRVELRREWGADETTFVVLFAGKLQPVKRPQDILDALAVMDGKFLAVFVGAGEQEKTLQKIALERTVRAHFAGFKNQSEMPRCYAAADVLVLPSESETWGLVVNEAMACGLPAIISESVGCAPDLIEPGRTGFTFPVRDVAKLAARISELAGQSRAVLDFRVPLREKMECYSLPTAVAGAIRAVAALTKRRSSAKVCS